jgi:hypothetical protein
VVSSASLESKQSLYEPVPTRKHMGVYMIDRPRTRVHHSLCQQAVETGNDQGCFARKTGPVDACYGLRRAANRTGAATITRPAFPLAAWW